MKIWHCDAARPVPGLVPGERERPEPGAGEVLVRIRAAGVTPTELLWYPTTHTRTGEPRRGAIPGHEFSGNIVAVGAGVEMAVGDDVFGMNDWFSDGATAEFCCAPASALISKPAGLTHAEAASIPIGALTAWQGLFERARIQPGERVLIHGGSGAVGVFAIQLARWSGAEVLTTAASRNREFLLTLGAEKVIDYRHERFEESARGVDVVFDAVGGATLERSWDVLGSGGRLVTIAASSESEVDERAKRAFFIVEPNRKQLGEIAELVVSGQLQPVVAAVVPFDDAGLVYAGQVSASRGCGKAVITL